MSQQLSLRHPVLDVKKALEGFHYLEEILSVDEEALLVAFARKLQYEPYVMRGQPSLRGIVRFGTDYGSVGSVSSSAPKIPQELLPLRERSATLAGVNPKKFTSALVTRYPARATIGWHRDLPMFGPVVLGVSLAATCKFKLRNLTNPQEIFSLALAPRSLYILSGNARTDWQHSIPPLPALRYSVTFRSLSDTH